MTTVNVEESTPAPTTQAAPVVVSSDASAIAETAATAAVAAVTAEGAAAVATEAATDIENIEQRQDTEWRITQDQFSSLETRMMTIEGQLADLTAQLTPPPTDEGEEPLIAPPELEMEVAPPPQATQKERKGIFVRSHGHQSR